MDVAVEGPVFAELQPFNNFNSIQHSASLQKALSWKIIYNTDVELRFLSKRQWGFSRSVLATFSDF
jgi:hypothetical protein